MSVYLFVSHLWSVYFYRTARERCRHLEGSILLRWVIWHVPFYFACQRRRYTLFKVTRNDELDARTSSCNDSETALTSPIEYMYPPKWQGRDSANCTWILHVDTRRAILNSVLYMYMRHVLVFFFSNLNTSPEERERESCGKWDDHLGERE